MNVWMKPVLLLRHWLNRSFVLHRTLHVRPGGVAKDLRERAGKIDETTLATNKEMQQQAELSDELVNAAQDLQRSVSVFKLAQPPYPE